MDYSRRQFLHYGSATITMVGLGGMLAACGRGSGDAPAAGAPAVVALSKPSDAFMSLSRTVTGFDAPDALLAARLYAELSGAYPEFDKQLPLIGDRLAKTPAAGDAFGDAPALRELFQQLLGGWYLGVLGSPKSPRCVAFENIVSYRVVAASVQPPSYCSGEVNFWVRAPA